MTMSTGQFARISVKVIEVISSSNVDNSMDRECENVEVLQAVREG